MASIREGAIFTNVALTLDNDVWWEGMNDNPPAHLIDWVRRPCWVGEKRNAAHPNARFTVAARQCPVMAPEWEDPKGVPISAILFGGRRATTVPLVIESLSWQHGVFLGSIMASEKTAAAAGRVGVLRRDPMAMLPFCGYNMGDYFSHWLSLGKLHLDRVPRIFHVNWFRKDAKGRFLWPGYGENSRVLKWIFERLDGEAEAVETPIGKLPPIKGAGGLDLSGLSLSPADAEELLRVDVSGWLGEIPLIREHYSQFGNALPQGLKSELMALEERLKAAREQGNGKGA
jgi:phosphoenolpyruvate carboxykinase (GTP)